jgi:hypothetical protein
MAVAEIELDLPQSAVRVPRDLVHRLAAAAAKRAGISSRHRELSLLLNRALDAGRIKLGNDEERALRAVLEEEGLALPQQDGAGRGPDSGG